MKSPVGYCTPEDRLTACARIMWQKDCGVVPIVDPADRKVVGIVTDRDICISVASREQRASEIRAAELINGRDVVTCGPGDDLKNALKKMRKNAVRRLPVVSRKGELTGMISISDIMLAADKKALRKRVYSTLKAIARPHRIILKELAG